MKSVMDLAQVEGYRYEKEKEEKKEKERLEKVRGEFALQNQVAYDLSVEYGFNPYSIVSDLHVDGRHVLYYVDGDEERRVWIYREGGVEGGSKLTFYTDGGRDGFRGKRVESFPLAVYVTSKKGQERE